MFHLALFVLLANAVIVLSLYVSSTLTGFPELNFINDFFFYSAMIQLAVGTFFTISPPNQIKHLKYSPSKATRVTETMANDSQQGKHPSTVDVSLGGKFFLSGALSLALCFLL